MYYPFCISKKLCWYVLICFCYLAIHCWKILRIFWLQYPLISDTIQLLIISFPIFLYKNKMKIELIKNCYYCHFDLTYLITMPHSDFSKCHMISTIEAWTMVPAIKLMSLYKNWLEIVILLFSPFEKTNTYLCSTHYLQAYSIEVYSDWNSNSKIYLFSNL